MTLALPEAAALDGAALAAIEGGGLIAWAAKADAAARIARGLALTAFVPESLRVRDANTGQLDLDLTIWQVTGALLKGEELNFGPMASLGAIDVIPPGSGQPALRALALGALLHMHGHHYWSVPGEQTASRCILRGRARDALPEQPDEEVQWDLQRATQLVGQRKMNDPSGNWRKQPATMLYWRALADLARRIAPEVLLGVPVLDVEVGDEPESGDPAENGAPAPARSGRSRPARPRAAATKRAGGAPPPAAPPATAPASAPPDAAGGAEGVPMINEDQRRALWAGMNDLGIKGRDASLRMVSQWVERDVGSSNDLTQAEASKALDAITAARDQLAQAAAAAAAQDGAEGEQEPGRQAAAGEEDDPGADDPGPDPPAPDE